MQEGLFGQTAAAAAHAAHHAATTAAQHAAQHAAAAAQQAAAAAAAHFTQNMNATNENGADGRPAQFRDSVAQGMEYLKEETDGLDASLENLHITKKKRSENETDTVEAPNEAGKETNEAGKETPGCDSAAAVEDNISEDWTMMEDINNSGNKPNIDASLYPVLVNTEGKCMAGTPFIFPPPGPHNPHCHFIFPDKVCS
ncbi:unnamed protein product [Gongylonema pulchrum]|uniref:Transcription factor SOX-6 n=1 Tax=Gongylonema pulchrum TaxID=637853 RepID=A0A183EMC3_9BILA|nr:unnamed protein product [Gongylonema pulchrum]